MSHSNYSHLEPTARIKHLSSQSDTVIVDAKIPLRRYFRSGLEMVRMASVYAEEGSLENAFILYMKFMTLFLEKIRDHPDFSTHTSIDKTNNVKKLKEILPKAEHLKHKLLNKYQKEYDVIVQQQLQLEEQLRQKKEAEEEEQRRLRQQYEEDNRRRRDVEEEERRIRQLEGFHLQQRKQEVDDAPPEYNSLGNLIYPTSVLSLDDDIIHDRTPSAPQIFSPPQPSSPTDLTPSIPARDLKPSPQSVLPIPQVDRSSKPVSLLSATIGGKSGGLREVVVPVELMSKFMALAQANTLRNIETCGVLAGKLAQHRLVLTHLLVPKQCGTSDSCTTQQEEELFDYQDKLDLITIGWIHTHPTQTAFLSSVDLHTHCSYQLMMPEALAIVCAPKYDETGFFTLSPNHGLSFIANCHQTGFHPHPKEPPLFQNAEHVTLDDSMSVKVIDLRNS
ncbi:hypothetical protein Pmani_001427 [Petrolisthes manimaculis]|uniref:MPN domain-containing protein n=1 Tax=Petrolisthes manimaculis TaxID=1843537 RepID=A0AAE1QN41_9EUCA|nr:hypothetical protein Pmani_001427 [Petrolisthes manimaculis]